MTDSTEESRSWEANSHSDSQILSVICGSRRFIVVFTSIHHRFLLWARWIQWRPFHSIFLRSIIILFYHQRLDHLSCLLPSGFPTKIWYKFLVSPMHDTCSVRLILLDLIIIIIFDEAYKFWRSSLSSLLQLLDTLCFLLSNLFSAIINLCCWSPLFSICVLWDLAYSSTSLLPAAMSQWNALIRYTVHSTQ